MGAYDAIMAAVAPNHRWRLDGRSGRALDSVGSRHGTLQPYCERMEPGPNGISGVLCDGTNPQILLPSSAGQSLNGASELWAIALARPDSAAAADRNILTLITTSGTLLSIGISSAGAWRAVGRSKTADAATILTGGSFTVGTWYVVSLRLKYSAPAAVEFWINDTMVASASPSGWSSTLSASAGSAADSIGYITVATQVWAGAIDDVALKAGTLPAGTLTALTAAIAAGDVAGTVTVGAPPVAAERQVVLISPAGFFAGSTVSDVAGAYSHGLPGRWPVYGLAYIDYGNCWTPITAVSLAARCITTSNNGHWYECESAGTTGGTEPTWPTDGSTVSDGTVVWRDKGLMERPWAEGPYVPPPA